MSWIRLFHHLYQLSFYRFGLEFFYTSPGLTVTHRRLDTSRDHIYKHLLVQNVWSQITVFRRDLRSHLYTTSCLRISDFFVNWNRKDNNFTGDHYHDVTDLSRLLLPKEDRPPDRQSDRDGLHEG